MCSSDLNYGGYSPWGGMTGSTPGTGGTTNQPVSGNISMRRMNIAGGPATRRPSVENVAGRSSERPGALEETKGNGNSRETILITPMRSIETHASNPTRDEVGRTPNGTIHYANPPQTESHRPDVETRRPETDIRRTPSPAVRQPEVQRSAPRNDPPQRTYNEPSRPTPSRTSSEPSRPASTPSYSAPARPSSPAPSRSTGGRGGR